jgi:2-polyprenyl-6-hydroxyphenyl methylase/3-demethylubiquinone-9 3-methyltransferase
MSSIGATVRRAFGPYERDISEIYRRVFIDLDDLVDRMRGWVSPASILEIGCGEGALAERLALAFPEASYLGIDIIPHLGRLYDGPQGKVAFRQIRAEALASECPGRFDLVVINDVLHHVPQPERPELLMSARRLMTRDGRLILKDWLRRPTPIHAACYFADACIGGDRGVRYMAMDEQRQLIGDAFGPGAIAAEAGIAPWRQNHAFLIRNAADQ